MRQARKTGPAAHLLAADKMPTAGAAWSGTETAADDVEVLGSLPRHLAGRHRRPGRRPPHLERRRLAPRAVQVVAKFADNKSAWRAGQVLEAWRSDCADRVAGTSAPCARSP